MSDSPTHAIVSFCQNLNPRTYLGLVLLTALFIAVFLGFETYTSHFAIARTAQEVAIFEQLVKLRESSSLSNEEEQIRLTLLRRLASSQSVSSPSIDYPITSKFMWGLSPWIVVVLMSLRSPKQSRKNLITGFSTMGVIFSTVAAILPSTTFLWTAFVIPWGLFAISTGAMLAFGITISLRAHKQNSRDKSDTEDKG